MKHVLYVHDQQDDPQVLKNYLEHVGFLVSLCSTVQQCLEIIGSDPPDIIVMDVLLTGENGFAGCKRIRERLTGTELPIILCSSIYRKRVYREEAWGVGAQGYMLRPFEAGELVRHIQTLTERSSRLKVPQGG